MSPANSLWEYMNPAGISQVSEIISRKFLFEIFYGNRVLIVSPLFSISHPTPIHPKIRSVRHRFIEPSPVVTPLHPAFHLGLTASANKRHM